MVLLLIFYFQVFYGVNGSSNGFNEQRQPLTTIIEPPVSNHADFYSSAVLPNGLAESLSKRISNITFKNPVSKRKRNRQNNSSITNPIADGEAVSLF